MPLIRTCFCFCIHHHQQTLSTIIPDSRLRGNNDVGVEGRRIAQPKVNEYRKLDNSCGKNVVSGRPDSNNRFDATEGRRRR